MQYGRFTWLTIAAMVSAALAPAAYAEWQTLTQTSEQRIEYQTSGQGDQAGLWSRLTLSTPQLDASSGQSYRSVHMLSQFDCRHSTVTTMERVLYQDNGNVLRRERLGQTAAPVSAGLEEKLFAAACPNSVAAVISSDSAPARVVHADMNSGAAHIVRVSEEGAKGNPEKLGPPDKAAQDRAMLEKFEGKVEIPGKIQLPPIRKPINPDVKPQISDPRPAPAPIEHKVAAPNPEAIPTPTKRVVTPLERGPGPSLRPPSASNPLNEVPIKRVAVKKVVAKPKNVKNAPHPHWSYEGETDGPAQWGKLSPAYSACENGTRQSPIDIREGVKVDLPPIEFDYQPSPFSIVDNGHTVQVTPMGLNAISIQGHRYELLQFHFHKPSEERINGRSYDLVAHLVHKDEAGKLAVVSVLFDRGRDNGLIQTLWNNLPLEQKQEAVPPDNPIDLNMILPREKLYYTYMGSLTTPPCTEGVLWLVLKTPMQVSDYQISVFGRLYKNNARPIQKTSGRLIKESR